MTISIIMPVYNNAKYLKEAIESILNLSYKDFELIIIDDCSTDYSRQIIEFYIKSDGRIKYLKNKKNLGSARTIKEGVGIAKGKYIFLAAGDDISLTNRIESHLSIYKKNTNVGIIVSNAIVIDSNSNETGELYIIDDEVTNENISINQLKRNYCLGATMSIFNDKKILSKDSMLDHTDDFEISLEYLLNDYEIYLLKEPTIKYRIHNKNQSNKRYELNKKIINVYNKYKDDEIISFLKRKKCGKKEAFLVLGIIKIFVEDYKKAKYYLLKADEIFNFNRETNFEVKFYLGVVNFINSDFIKSSYCFKECLKLHKNKPEVLNNFSIVNFLIDNNIEKFRTSLKEALKIKKDYIDANYNLECLNEGIRKFKITKRILEKNNIIRKDSMRGDYEY
ncbi:glycosyltransferase [Clostridium beijerinckii]|uniref:glycosyltransferase n=1 Tax=Clostridium beijerinckii TaxID=1520 RepID=UPI0013612647|nr:glycosyltransferase [Clostridium beijerinckii]MZK49881.1 glycosyltransferase [Clostridium beijerinckii]MZK57840.1 glycosyltransferase [Clostridium beijerinckii]MZK68051.1 glycosyltransferase [Clostridium beijerinckii]MZK73549.1 glycosyltransferase [Clostridium beijerinckii]MZK83131.1 glycosyltransferase [Clostridium beijerinckii]